MSLLLQETCGLGTYLFKQSGIGKHRTGPSHLSVPWSSWDARLEKLSALTFLLLALIGALVKFVRILSFALTGAHD